MENLQFLLSGFSVLFTGQNILIACLGAILGILSEQCRELVRWQELRYYCPLHMG